MENPYNNNISILILDFLKPDESRKCLESVHKNCQFKKQIIYLSNGGGFENQKYVIDFYSVGLIDKLILNKENNGLGWGTEDLFRICDTEFTMMLQNDQIINYNISQNQIDILLNILRNNEKIGAISLAGFPCGNNIFSDRCHIIKTSLYNKIPKTHGGCGKWNHLKYNEQCCQEYFQENNLQFIATETPLVIDNGVWTIRELPCGGIVKMKTDTKETFWINPPKNPYVFPEMDEKDWEDAISGNWEPGRIPNKMAHLSFKFWD